MNEFGVCLGLFVCLFVCLRVLGLDSKKNFRPAGYLLRVFRFCYGLVTFLFVLVLLSFDLARFCFKTSLIDRSGFFKIFEFFST